MKTEFDKFKRVEYVPDFQPNSGWRGRNYDLLHAFMESEEQCMYYDYGSVEACTKRMYSIRASIRGGHACSEFKDKVAIHKIGSKLYLVRLIP